MANAFRRFVRPYVQGLMSKERVGAGDPVTPDVYDLRIDSGSDRRVDSAGNSRRTS